ncbi:LysR family transcriptional regulator [Paracoccus sp. IB05]|nr:LysR family transcriptional regulator [Paracoccus sp. IB05]
MWFSARSGRNAIAAEDGITGAARHLGPGQPSASRALRPLEDRIGYHFVIASWRLLMILTRADGSAP